MSESIGYSALAFALAGLDDNGGGGGGQGGGTVSVQVVDTITGDPGTQAAVVNLGNDQTVQLQFTVPQGPVGQKGDKGEDGPMWYTSTSLPVVNIDGIKEGDYVIYSNGEIYRYLNGVYTDQRVNLQGSRWYIVNTNPSSIVSAGMKEGDVVLFRTGDLYRVSGGRLVSTGINIMGPQGVSPTVVVKTDTESEYVLTITDATGSFDTPNLKGSGGGDSRLPQTTAEDAGKLVAVKEDGSGYELVEPGESGISYEESTDYIFYNNELKNLQSGDKILYDGLVYTVGTTALSGGDGFNLELGAPMTGSRVTMLPGNYVGDITISGSSIFFVGSGSKLTGSILITGDNCSVLDLDVEDSFDTKSGNGEYKEVSPLTVNGDNCLLENVVVRGQGSFSGVLFKKQNSTAFRISGCDLGSGTFSDGKSVGALRCTQRVVNGEFYENRFLGNVYFNNGVNGLEFWNNNVTCVNGSVVSFAYVCSGRVEFAGNLFFDDTLNNMFKFNGTGTVGTSVGVDCSGLQEFKIASNEFTIKESLIYAQPGMTADAGKFNIVGNTLKMYDGAILFKDENQPVVGFELGEANIISTLTTAESPYNYALESGFTGSEEDFKTAYMNALGLTQDGVVVIDGGTI